MRANCGKKFGKNREGDAVSFGGFPHGFAPEDIPDPSLPTTFEECKLRWDHAERDHALAWRNFLRQLLEVRAQYVVPIMGPALCGGRLINAPEQCLFVDWKHGSGLLGLRANMGQDGTLLGNDVDLATEVYSAGVREGDRTLHGRSVRLFCSK